jgi:uncharacterized protein
MNVPSPTLAERLAIRVRPTSPPLMYQSWGKLLFMHWPIPVAALRPLIPARLSIDTFAGQSWIGLVPFTMWNIRPRLAPPIPGVSAFHEINVRTYVHLDGVPGVWFFSLDANSWLAVKAARYFYHLPYFYASMRLQQKGETIYYYTSRHDSVPGAEFDAAWTIGPALAETTPGSLDYFLTERYCLYAARGKRLYRCRIFHPPWPLQEARLLKYRSNLIEADGLPRPQGEPLLHSGGPVQVAIWPLEQV